MNDHQTAPPADSDGQPGPSGAPVPPQGAPLQTCHRCGRSIELHQPGHGHYRARWLPTNAPAPDACPDLPAAYCSPEPYGSPDHQTPQGATAGTEGNAVDAEGATPLAPAPAAPALHGVTAPSGAAVDRPDQDVAPLVGAPHASPWPLREPCGYFSMGSIYNCTTCGHTGPAHWAPKYASPVAPAALDVTGLAPDRRRDQVVNLAANVARLSAVLEFIVADLDADRTVPAHLVRMAREALSLAAEATS